DFGMGHATTYAQMLTDMLGVPFDRVRMVEGDSDRMAFGGGSGGSSTVGSATTDGWVSVGSRSSRYQAPAATSNTMSSNQGIDLFMVSPPQ
ncbi:molybdopterin cofactor-binding domain-containing protein, partial [Klebsiella pneumoniae]|uniref:molybdopterin cofactor-binding domain-containing protein n=1 Tax=Klebsiella pneumoniae TaxID=573 RepID=UPI003A7FD42A